MRLKIAVVGLNPGTAIYANLMARHDNEVTMITSLDAEYVELTDLKLHTSLGVLNPQVGRLFSIKYLGDIVGVNIIRTNLNNVNVLGSEDVIINGRQYHFDKVIVGGEVVFKAWKDPVQDLINSGMGIRIVGNDPGLTLTTALLISEMGGKVHIDVNGVPVDNDVLRLLPLNYSTDYGEVLDLSYDIKQPITKGNVDIISKGVAAVDSLSGLSYVVARDYELMIRGKLLALRDLGLIDVKPVIPRLEVGLGVKWTYVAMGLGRNELARVYRDLSSSRISYRQEGKDLVVKALYRGGKLLGMQVLMRGLRNLNWIYALYALLITGNTPLLLLDMGYEELGTVRGILEHLMMDVLSI